MLIETINASDFSDYDQHDRLLQCTDGESGLNAFIAIHNLNLGAALGGCRIFPYGTDKEAITDVLRLSKGMTYKSALANLKLGGGKAVILADAKTQKTPELLRAMGKFVDSLNGDYITAEDSGTTVADLALMAEETKFTAGVINKQLSDGSTASGDPSPSTAYGVYVGIKACLAHRFGDASLSGVSIAVQGVGNVGRNLVRLLAQDGAEILVSDAYQPAIDSCLEIADVKVVNNKTIHAEKVDVFSPCALGSAINMTSLVELRAPIIAGAANNQLENKEAGSYLFHKDVTYAPDYVINAGGIIDIFYEQAAAAYCHKQVIEHIDGISLTLERIFNLSKQHSKPSFEMADRLAESIFLGKPIEAVA